MVFMFSVPTYATVNFVSGSQNPINRTATIKVYLNSSIQPYSNSSTLINCTLYVDGIENQTINNGINNSIFYLNSSELADGSHSWYINCTDDNYITQTKSPIYTIFTGGKFNDCAILSDENETYYLTKDIIDSSTSYCINISANNVILDCQGHIIDGDDTAEYGIYIYRSSETVTNETVKNCIVSDWDSANIYLNSVDGNKVINVTSTSSPSYGIHIYYHGRDNGIINSTLSENSIADFYISILYHSDCDNYLENVIGSNNLPIKYFNYSVNLANEALSELILCDADYSNITNITIDASSTLKNNMLYSHLTDYSNFTFVNSSNNYYGIYIKSGSNNQIINTTTYNNTYGIYIYYSGYNSIINSTTANNTYGIYLTPEHTTYTKIYGSTIINNSNGIYLLEASNTSIMDTLIGSSTTDYFLHTVGTTNNFTNTGFTEERTIKFFDASSWFNYNNRTDIELWLKTNVSSQSTITRKLINWNQSLIEWNDSASTAVIARYNITGLNPDKYYLVYNNSELTYTFQTDASGNLPSFTIYLNSEHDIKVEESPYHLYNCTNITQPGTYYLTTDITDSSATYCMNISANNVTLDCQGHLIDGIHASHTYGILVNRSFQQTTNITIKKCLITDWSHAIYFGYSNSNNLTNLTLNNNYNGGVGLHHSDYNTLSFIVANRSNYGLSLDNSNYNNFSDVTFEGGAYYGLYIYNSDNLIVENSIFRNNGYFDISIDGGPQHMELINVTGTDDKPIVYYNTSVILQDWDNNVSEIILYNASYSVLQNITINRTGRRNNGIILWRTNYCNLTDIKLNKLFHGIELAGSLHNRLSNITVTSSYYGVIITYGNGHSNNNSLTNITVKNNSYGIGIRTYSSGNVVSNSIIQDNTIAGIVMYYAGYDYPNKLYNDLFNNTINIKFSGDVYPNNWNTSKQIGDRIYSPGIKIGGNYWTNSTSNGYSDTCTDSNKDGFCDQAYDILDNQPCTPGIDCSNNTDYLPLSSKYATTIHLTSEKVWWNDSVTAYGQAARDTQVVVKLNGTTYCTNQSDSEGNWFCTFNAPLEIGNFVVVASAGTESASTTLTIAPNYGIKPIGTSDRIVYEQPMLIQDLNGKIKIVFVRIMTWRG